MTSGLGQRFSAAADRRQGWRGTSVFVRKHEAVSDCGFSNQIARGFRTRFDLPAQLIHEDPKVLDSVGMIGVPNSRQQLTVTQGPVRMSRKVPEKIHFLRGEAYLFSPCAHFTPAEIDLAVSE